MFCTLRSAIVVISASHVVRYFINHGWERRKVGQIWICCEEAVDVLWRGAEEKIHCLRCRQVVHLGTATEMEYLFNEGL